MDFIYNFWTQSRCNQDAEEFEKKNKTVSFCNKHSISTDSHFELPFLI